MDHISSLLPKILREEGSLLYHSFANADGKRWIMPDRNMKTSMNLYQPSSRKGKLMKRFFPYLKRFRIIRSTLGVERKYYMLDKELQDLLGRLFQNSSLEFSIFCGTPSVHQKITIQVSKDYNILGYCKVSDQEDIKKIFRHEQQMLISLKEKGMNQIPECIFCGPVHGNLDVFVQTTTKTNASEIAHHFDSRHWSFLDNMHLRTLQTLSFEQSEFSKMLCNLIFRKNYFTAEQFDIVNSAIEAVRKHFEEKEMVYSAYHADFTPWNSFVEKENLFVFDFEYSKLTFPPYIDYFHFFTQNAIFTKNWKAEKIFKKYVKLKPKIENYFSNSDIGYLCYLLEIIERYIDRDKENLQRDTISCISIWISLIQLVLSFQKE